MCRGREATVCINIEVAVVETQEFYAMVTVLELPRGYPKQSQDSSFKNQNADSEQLQTDPNLMKILVAAKEL